MRPAAASAGDCSARIRRRSSGCLAIALAISVMALMFSLGAYVSGSHRARCEELPRRRKALDQNSVDRRRCTATRTATCSTPATCSPARSRSSRSSSSGPAGGRAPTPAASSPGARGRLAHRPHPRSRFSPRLRCRSPPWAVTRRTRTPRRRRNRRRRPSTSARGPISGRRWSRSPRPRAAPHPATSSSPRNGGWRRPAR